MPAHVSQVRHAHVSARLAPVMDLTSPVPLVTHLVVTASSLWKHVPTSRWPTNPMINRPLQASHPSLLCFFQTMRTVISLHIKTPLNGGAGNSGRIRNYSYVEIASLKKTKGKML